MIVHQTLNFGASQYSTDDNADIKQVDRDLGSIFNCLQGRVAFGTGVSGNNGENIYGQFLQITSNAVANTETTFTHTCITVPVGYLILWQSKAGSLYQGPATGTAWTTTGISLKCSVASVTFLLFLLK